jgi:UDP-glucose 4-epimerase
MAREATGMRALVLGGGGFIGSHLTNLLLLEGYSVVVFDRPGVVRYRAFSEDESIVWIDGSLESQADVERAVAGCNVVFHLISTTLPKSSNADPMFDVQSNLLGTLRLLDACRSASVKKIVFASSGGTVYGTPERTPIAESHRTEPVSSYGILKLTIEKYLALYHTLYGLDYCILRLANPYGERQRLESAQGAIAVFMGSILKDRPIHIWGDGSVVRDYVYIEDVARAFLAAAGHFGDQRLFNIGAGEGRSLNELLDAIEHLHGSPVSRFYEEARPFDVLRNVLDITHAAQELHWQPKVAFAEGLQRAYEWAKRSIQSNNHA